MLPIECKNNSSLIELTPISDGYKFVIADNISDIKYNIKIYKLLSKKDNITIENIIDIVLSLKENHSAFDIAMEIAQNYRFNDMTVQELLYGMMLHSGNDAAVALAIYCGGTLEGFVQMMNDKARVLDLENTHFANPHGLDHENHYSTAADLGKLATYAMKNPIFSKVVSTKNVRIGDRYLKNHNKLLWSLEGAEGVKTGYTKRAGRILVSCASRDGRRLVAVTIADPNDWRDHSELLEMGFANFCPCTIVKKNTVVGMTEVAGGFDGKVQLIAADDFVYSVERDESIEVSMPKPGFVYAPVVAGQHAGDAQVYLNGQWIGKIPLIFGATIEKYKEPPKARIRLFGGNRP